MDKTLCMYKHDEININAKTFYDSLKPAILNKMVREMCRGEIQNIY